MDGGMKKQEQPKILIVDDITMNVEILQEILKSQGYETLCALSVQEALDIMKNNMPQLILTDFSMPGMNGLEFCRLLKSNPMTRDIPLIFATVADSSADRKKAFEAGVVDFIRKPFEPIEVIMSVKNQMNSYYAKRELEDYNRMMHKMVTEQKKQMEKEQEKVLLALQTVAERRNAHEGSHLRNVGYNSRLLAQCLQLVPKYEKMVNNVFIETIGVAARLHDIGNILMPDEAFLDEYRSKVEQKNAFVRHHTEEGARLLEELGANEGNRFLDMAVLICRYHHAKWDGSGYPENLAGEDIPLEARITAVANDFDALLRARYKSEPLSLEESVGIINERSGKAYDARIIEVFNKVVKQMRTD